MGPPARDSAGRILPYDDPRIGDSDTVLRFIDPQYHWVADANQNSWRVSSGLFCQSSIPNGGMSVEVERLILTAGLTLEKRLPYYRCGIARLLVGDLRDLHLAVGLDPLPENPYHCQVWGIGNNRRIRRELARLAEMIVEPKPF
jgi:hypothetical protein